MAKDKDEIPNFDHLNLDGPEPAAPQPAAESSGKPPELPQEPQPAAEEPTIDFTFEEAGSEPAAAVPVEPVEEPGIDFTVDEPRIEAEAAATPAEPASEGDAAPEFVPKMPGDDIDFGISGDAGEEIHAEEEQTLEVSEEQLADAAAARKLNTAALVLMAVGGLGVVAGFVLAFLKGVTTWLAVLIGIHYAALPGLLLALGLFLFFALKKAGGTATLDGIKQGRVYEGVLAVAFLALWIAGFCLLGELSTYGYDVKATTAPRSVPTSGV